MELPEKAILKNEKKKEKRNKLCCNLMWNF